MANDVNTNSNTNLDAIWDEIKKEIRRSKKISFTNLDKKIDQIRLDNCEIDNDMLTDNVFDDFTEVVVVNLNNNNLSYLNVNLFNKLTKLKKLKLYNNQITHLDNELFQQMEHITEINFSFNLIKDLNKDLFKGREKLKNVFFFGNKLKFLGENLFEDCIDLEWIVFNNNQIKSLDENLFAGKCKSIKYIEMRNNQINHHLSQNLFKGLNKLEKIDFKSNQITGLDESIFKECSQSINQIEFSQNKIKNVGHYLFHNCDQLKSVNFRSNKLKNLPENVFQNLSQLVMIDFSYNQIDKLNIGAISTNMFIDFRNNIDLDNIELIFYNLFQEVNYDKFKNRTDIPKNFIDFYKNRVEINDINQPTPKLDRIILVRYKDFCLNCLFSIFVNKICFYQHENTNRKSFDSNKEKLLNLEQTVLDFLISMPELAFSNINLISLHRYIENRFDKNKYVENLEYKFLSADSIINLIKRNDVYLFNLYFPKEAIQKKDFELIKKYIYNINYLEFLSQVKFGQCFNKILKNDNQEMAIYLLMLIKFVIDATETSEHVKNKLFSILFDFLCKIEWKKWENFIRLFLDLYKTNDTTKLLLKELENENETQQPTSNDCTNDVEQGTRLNSYIVDHATSINTTKINRFLGLVNSYKSNEFLLHPTTLHLLNQKWKIYRLFYWLNVLLSILLLIFYSIHIELSNQQSTVILKILFYYQKFYH